MADPRVYPVGTITDLDGRKVTIGVDYGAVTVSGAGRFEGVQRSAFLALFADAIIQSMADEAGPREPVLNILEAGS